jgi:2-oxoglutarate ferredoxin oxidoreductase subunit beta
MPRSLEQYLRPGVKATAFCPGCGHGILLHAVLRAVDELGLERRNLLFVSGIGCAAWVPSPHILADTLHTLHGRAIAYATGAKLANPMLEVVVVSGDGDIVSIGGNHLIHAARRGADLTVVCADNEIYGMTGGQAGPTTPVGALSATTPHGNPHPPFDLVKLVLGAGARYAARFAVTQPRPLVDALKRAIATPGFTFVDVVSPCPTQFGRRNRIDQITALYDRVRRACISREDAAGLPASALRDRIVTGEWTQDDLLLAPAPNPQPPAPDPPGGSPC